MPQNKHKHSDNVLIVYLSTGVTIFLYQSIVGYSKLIERLLGMTIADASDWKRILSGGAITLTAFYLTIIILSIKLLKCDFNIWLLVPVIVASILLPGIVYYLFISKSVTIFSLLYILALLYLLKLQLEKKQ